MTRNWEPAEDNELPAEKKRAGWSPESWHPPTVDDDESELQRTVMHYPAWREGETFVVSGPLASFPGRGRRFTTWDQARAHVVGKYGEVLEEIRDAIRGGRWAFRCRKPKQP